MPTVPVAGWSKFVVRVDTKVPALVNVNDEVIPFDTDRVDDVLVNDRDEFLDAVLSDALVHDQSAVDHAVCEMQVKPADWFAVFEDCVALRLLGAYLAFEIKSWHWFRQEACLWTLDFELCTSAQHGADAVHYAKRHVCTLTGVVYLPPRFARVRAVRSKSV
jgi:hypothetical protein